MWSAVNHGPVSSNNTALLTQDFEIGKYANLVYINTLMIQEVLEDSGRYYLAGKDNCSVRFDSMTSHYCNVI